MPAFTYSRTSFLKICVVVSLFNATSLWGNIHPEPALRSFKCKIINPASFNLKDKLSAYTIFQLDIQALNDSIQAAQEEALIELSVGRHHWILALRPNPILAPNYSLVIEENGIFKTVNRPRPNAYLGYEIQDGGKAGLVVNANFMEGFVIQQNSMYYIEPLTHFYKDAPVYYFVVHTEHSELNEDLQNSTKNDIVLGQVASGAACGSLDLEIAIASDKSMFTKYGSVIAVENHNVAVLNNAQALFSGVFTQDINFEIVTQYVVVGSDPWGVPNDMNDYLSKFKTWANSGNFGVPYDLAELWTNLNALSPASTGSLGYLGSLCTTNKYHLVKDNSNDPLMLRYNLTQAIGYNLGAFYDANCPPDNYLMCPSVSLPPNSWSPGSISAINAFVAGKIGVGCLSGMPAVGINNLSANGLSGTFTLSGGQPQIDGSNYTSVSMTLQSNPGVTSTLMTAPFTHGETVSFTCPQAGDYDLVVTDNNGCVETAVVAVFTPPCLTWQKALGGSSNDGAESVLPTPDGGYIMAGSTFSTNGDVSGNHGNEDVWIVKLNVAGKMQWQKTLGGTLAERAHNIQLTGDGGYVIAGYSDSNDGDVSGNQGGRDVWVVKLSATGDLQWQKTYGGSSYDAASTIQATADGGFIVAGASSSSDGDLTENQGNLDGWVFKINASGQLQWQEALGGSSQDYLHSPKPTADGGYILAGFTNSNGGDVSGNHGGGDIWVVKLTSNGALEWQKCLGGSAFDDSQSLVVAADGGYIIAGSSASNNGDVSGNHGGEDAWIVKLDATGALQWQKCLGGTQEERVRQITATPDGGYIVAGHSFSDDGDVSGNQGLKDAWIFKINQNGALQWQKSLGGDAADYATAVQPTADNGYIVAGVTASVNGDVSGNHGMEDAWVVKLGGLLKITPAAPILCTGGSISLDAGNGFGAYQWSNSAGTPGITVNSPGQYAVTVTGTDGCTAAGSVQVVAGGQGLDCGLIAYYPLDGNAQDTSGNGNHGTPFKVTGAKDRFGNCDRALGFYQCAGTDESGNHVTLPLLLNDIMEAFSLTLWVKEDSLCESAGEAYIFFGNENSNHNPPEARSVQVAHYSAGAGKDSIYWNVSAYNSVTIPFLSTDRGRFVFYALVYENGIMKAYKDNVLVGQGTGLVNMKEPASAALAQHWWVNGATSTRFKGEIDDVRIYKRALPPAEIAAIYNLPNDNPNPLTAELSASSTTLCPGDSITLNAAPVQPGYVYAWYRDGNLLPGATGSVYKAFQTGTYQVRVAGGGCDSLSAPLTLDAFAPVTANISTPGGTQMNCSLTTVLLNASGGDVYTWTGPNGFTFSDPQPAVSNPGIYTVTVANSSTGCSDTASVVISLNNDPPGASAAGGVITCTNPVILVQGNSLTSGVIYSWSGPNGFMFNGQNSPVNTAGNYTLTVTDPATGCTSTATATVMSDNVPPSVTVFMPSYPQIDCTNGIVTLQVDSFGGYTYAWSGGLGNNPVAEAFFPGTYTVTVTNTANGCSATSSATVTENKTIPDISAAGGELTCAQSFVILQGSSSTPGVTYLWTGPNGFAVAQSNPPVNVPGTYTFTVSNPENGCAATATATVGEDKTPPGISATGGQLSCQTLTVELSGDSGTPGATMSWTGPGGFVFNGPNPVVNLPGAYTLTVTNPLNGCTAVQQVTVDPPLVLTPVVSGSTKLCPGSTLTLTAESGYTVYEWSTGFTTAQITVNQPGDYTLTVTDASQCTGTLTLTVTPVQPPAPFISGPMSLCTGSSIIFDAGAGYTGYSWSSGQNTQTVAVTMAGSYTVTVTDTNGCTGVASKTITSMAAPNPGAGSNSPVCAGEQLKLFAGSSAGWTYNWTGPGGFVSTAQNPVRNSMSADMAGLYIVTVTDGNNCTGTASVAVHVAPNYFLENDTVVCTGNTLLNGKPVTVDTTIQQIFTTSLGCDSISILAVDVVEAQAYIAVTDTFFCPPGQGSIIHEFEPVTNDNTGGNSWKIGIEKDPVAGIASVTDDSLRLLYQLQDLSFRGLDTIVYRLCDANCDGPCSIARIYIVVQDDIKKVADDLPNGFTPNGDGINDFFNPLQNYLDQNYIVPPGRVSITILNRWGEIIYQSNPYQYFNELEGGWDGRNGNGKPVTPGTYYYMLRMGLGETIVVKGAVQVLTD